MARQNTPDPLSRRHLLEKSLDPAQASKIAAAYLEEGRRAEAIAFLECAGDTQRLEAIVEEAQRDGDVFMLKSACAALQREPSEEQWRRTADAAEAAGKVRYAETARRQIAGGDS